MNDAERAAASAAYQHFQRGDSDAAERLLGPVVGAHPGHVGLLSLMALILQAQGRLAEAEHHWRVVLTHAPGDGEYLSNLGVVLDAQGRHQEAAEIFRSALAADASLLGARQNLVHCLISAGAAEDAVREALVLSAQDSSAPSLDVLAAAQRAAGDFAAALAATERALVLEPRSQPLRHTRALALDRLGRGGEALAEWEALAREGARAPDIVINHAHALNEAGRAADAEALLVGAANEWPDNVAVQSQLARQRWLQGDSAGFSATMEAALSANPTHSALRTEAANLLFYAGAIKRAEHVLRDAPASDVAIAKALSNVLAHQGRLDEALVALDRHPTAALAGDRAVVLLRLGRAAEALEAMRAFPHNPRVAQQMIAFEATAMRMLGDERYRHFYDYDNLVRAYEVAPPFGDTASFNAELAKSLRALHQNAAHPLDQTLRNGTQTGGDLRYANDPNIRAFFEALDAPIRDYIAALSPSDPVGARRRSDYSFHGCWSVRLRPGGFHGNHIHNAGWISSAYYVSLPPVHGEAGAIKFGEPPWPLPNCGPEKIVVPKVGLLVLFPSYMWHGTIPFADGEERLTIAFDLVPS
jgi:Flp pilus assembly protein TadD